MTVRCLSVQQLSPVVVSADDVVPAAIAFAGRDGAHPRLRPTMTITPLSPRTAAGSRAAFALSQ